MKKVFLITLLLGLFIISCKDKADSKKEETEPETVAEPNVEGMIEDDWTVLFDGSSFKGWHGYLLDSVPSVWKLEDGAMVFYPPIERKPGESFNIVTDNEYTNFILSLEWKISDAGNSGIFWGVNEDPAYTQPYQTGPEIQVLDNLKHPDAKNGTSHQAGALYDMVAPSKDMVKPVGEWNSCIIMVNHVTNEGKVSLNGVEIVTFPVNGEQWNAMIDGSKFSDWNGFGKFTTGKIGLQDHGDIVAYRNIKIKEL
ncbi:MAG: DUF1080 domain-containing protein [Saonia sp.]